MDKAPLETEERSAVSKMELNPMDWPGERDGTSSRWISIKSSPSMYEKRISAPSGCCSAPLFVTRADRVSWSPGISPECPPDISDSKSDTPRSTSGPMSKSMAA